MNKETLCNEMRILLKDCWKKEVEDSTIDLFSSPYNFAARDIAYLLSKLQDRYKIDLNQIVQNLMVYSIDNIADALLIQIR